MTQRQDNHMDAAEEYDWPMFLTPTQRQKLLQAKIDRIKAMMQRQHDQVLNHQLHCNETHCQCR